MKNNNTTNAKKYAVAYCRVIAREVSDVRYCLNKQEEACIQAIEDNGYELLKVIRDYQMTSKHPEIQELCNLVAGKKINAVFTLNPSTISRKLREYLELKNLFEHHGIEIKYIDQSVIAPTLINEIIAMINEYNWNVSAEMEERKEDL